MIIHVISDNTARRIQPASGVVLCWTGDTSTPDLYWDQDERLVCVTERGEALISLEPITTKCDGLEAMCFYHTLFNQTDKDFQRHPDTGRIISYRYMHPVEYIFGV